MRNYKNENCTYNIYMIKCYVIIAAYMYACTYNIRIIIMYTLTIYL